MRWRRKHRIEYINSYIRLRSWYAWFPYCDTTGEWRWCEWVTVREIYSNYWRCQRFVDNYIVEPR